MVGEKGQLFTLDALFSMILITLILGISLNSIDTIAYRVQEFAGHSQLKRVANDAIEAMVKISDKIEFGLAATDTDPPTSRVITSPATQIHQYVLNTRRLNQTDFLDNLEKYLDVNADGTPDYLYRIEMYHRDLEYPQDDSRVVLNEAGESQATIQDLDNVSSLERIAYVEVISVGGDTIDGVLDGEEELSAEQYADYTYEASPPPPPRIYELPPIFEHGEVGPDADYYPVIIRLYIPEEIYNNLLWDWSGVYIKEIEVGPAGFPTDTEVVEVNKNVVFIYSGEEVPHRVDGYPYYALIGADVCLKPGWNYIILSGPLRDARIRFAFNNSIEDYEEEILYHIYTGGRIKLMVGRY